MKLLRALGVFLSTVIAYLGVTLLGWGWGDLAGFFAQPPRTAYAVCVLVFGLLVGIQAYPSLEGIQDGAGQKETLVRRQHWIGMLLVGVLFAGLFFLPFSSLRGIAVFVEIPALLWAGVGFCAAGYLLVFWSGLALGRQYSAEVVLQKDHRLITGGPYRWIRHPRYLGILSLALGLTLLFHTWIGFLVSVLACGLIFFRIRDEERLLSQQFGAAWQTYVDHSWRLIPYLY